jgi:hypothetical protein
MLDPSLWVMQGSTRFYFSCKYNPKSNTTESVPASAKQIRGAIDPKVCLKLYLDQRNKINFDFAADWKSH